MLELLYECEEAYGGPQGLVPEDQARAVFGDCSVDGALATGLLRRITGCRRSGEGVVGLSDAGRARIDEERRQAVLAAMEAGDAALAALFGGKV